MIQWLTNLDFSILDRIQQWFGCAFLDVVMPAISFLGNVGWVWILLAFGLCATKKYRLCGILMLVGIVTGALIGNLTLKPLIARDRPCWIHDTIPLLIDVPRDYSFPSGHTLASTISALTLLYTDKRLGIPALMLALLIAFSRLYLYVHFPSDVLGAILLGIAVALCVQHFRPRIAAFLRARGVIAE